MNPELDWLHRASDYVPLAGVVAATVAWLTKQQTEKIRVTVRNLMDDHNRNGTAHIAVASALRAERGSLFADITKELNEQDAALDRHGETLARIEERLDSLIDAHNAVVGDDCAKRAAVHVETNPDYKGPYRRRTDPKGRG